jgi:archaellum component FlaF (FlaF/FlaG flagellin family)
MPHHRTIAEIFAFLFVLMLGIIALLMVGMASPTAAQPQDLANNSVDGERVDQNTIITNKEYDPDTQQVTISVYSDTRQRITISDAGALFQGKEIDQTSTFALPGDHINLTVSVTPVRRQIAVAMATENTQRGILVEKESFLITGPWDSLDAQITGTAGLLAGLAVTTLFSYRRTSQRDNEPERKL